MQLHASGRIDLDAPIKTWLPTFAEGDRAKIVVRDLLAHCAGFPAWKPYWKAKLPIAEAWRRIEREPLETAPRAKTRYSDIGVLLLGRILEKIEGESLDRIAQHLVFGPLGMKSTRFGPLPAGTSVAPTEVVPERGGVVRGRVHDENADALGGVAAHAGLFATANDVAIYCQALLAAHVADSEARASEANAARSTRKAGARAGFAPASVRLFTARAELVPGSSRGLGFDTASADTPAAIARVRRRSSAGTKLDASAFGHTGFTGTSFWCDPTRRLAIVCLSNRVHPTRKNRKISAFRRALHDLVVDALER